MEKKQRRQSSSIDVKATVKRVLEDKEVDNVNGIVVMATGQIEFGDFQGIDRIYCKYDFTYGQNWKVVHGIDKGISQLAEKSDNGDTRVVWNFPIDVVFKGISPHGWPRLVISVFGLDSFGRDVVRGYGSMHLPTVAGSCSRNVRMFRPVPTSLLQQFLSWINGTPPEFYDSRFVSRSQGREATMVKSGGVVHVKLNLLTRGLEHNGFHGGKFYEEREKLQTTQGRRNSIDDQNNDKENNNSFQVR